MSVSIIQIIPEMIGASFVLIGGIVTIKKMVFAREKEINKMTLKELFINASKGAENCKVILGIRMPDGTKEMIINDNVKNKVEYVCGKYDDDLKMIGAPIFIEEFLFIKK